MAKMKDKVELDLLKKLVGELEVSLQTAEGIRSAVVKKDDESSHNDFIVEMAKAAGLAAGAMNEASLLVMDIQGIVLASQGITGSKSSSGGDALLDKILGFGKGNGNTN